MGFFDDVTRGLTKAAERIITPPGGRPSKDVLGIDEETLGIVTLGASDVQVGGAFGGERTIGQALTKDRSGQGNDDELVAEALRTESPPGVDTIEEFQLRQQGFISIPLPGGGTRIVQIPDNQLDAALGKQAADQLRLNRSINLLTSQRTEDALRGNLPVSPAFEEDAAERLARETLGVLRTSGVRSTSGANIISNVQSSNALLREQIRRGEISSGQTNVLQQTQSQSDILNRILQGQTRNKFQTAQLGLQQQDLNTQLQIANLLGRQGAQAGQQQLIGQIVGATAPSLIRAAAGGGGQSSNIGVTGEFRRA